MSVGGFLNGGDFLGEVWHKIMSFVYGFSSKYVAKHRRNKS